MSHLYTSESRGFLMFSGGKEMEHCMEMDKCQLFWEVIPDNECQKMNEKWLQQ